MCSQHCFQCDYLRGAGWGKKAECKEIAKKKVKNGRFREECAASINSALTGRIHLAFNKIWDLFTV